ncbi:MAG: GNAT family N-acetyltransferase [Muribaculaceae bacterium]|nr:GNAT family N-acetyltransferase [Muribaculaceae bacterium]
MKDNNKYIIRSLESESFDCVADAFLRAFEDYDLTFDRQRLRDMLVRRGADMELSFGAFYNGELVSFILNGIADYAGRKTAYDTGTGTVSSARGAGLIDRIFQWSLPRLRDAGVERYLLEVLTHNTTAIKIYRRMGFEITRSFDCFAGRTEDISIDSEENENLEIRRGRICDIERLQHFCDFAPSWQNSLSSILRAERTMECLIACLSDNTPVGYLVAEPAYGDIAQIAVAPDYRRRGVARRLLRNIISLHACDNWRVVNIPDDYLPMKLFLQADGFGLTCSQYEMVRSL